jgi:uncharacterized membrane protein YfcA
MDILTLLLAIFSGGLVGFSLGLIGGGGSILATPLLLYIVGVKDPHVVIGTSALVVAASAAGNLAGYAKRGHIRWKPALAFALCGMIGAFFGSTTGKNFPGEHLLFLFAILMIVIALRMIYTSQRPDAVEKSVQYPVLAAIAFGVGALAGFFGIGGGFLIVPGLILATGMPMISAVGSSLVSVTGFGLATAINYAMSGLVDWVVAAIFIGGGLAGGFAGRRVARRLALTRGALHKVFAAIVLLVAFYMLFRQWNMLFTPAV